LIISTSPSNKGDEWEDAAVDAQDEWREFSADASLHGQRLDKALAIMCPELSRSYLQQLIEAQEVTVAGAVAIKPSGKVLAGQRLRVHLVPTEQARAFTPTSGIEFEVLHSDAHLMVINKPAGLVVHPAAGHWTDTLLNGLLAMDSGFADLPRAGIVHRLDKDTSGLMVVARTRACMDALVKAIAAREVKREYLAIASGAWKFPEQTRVCELPIGRDTANRLRMAAITRPEQSSKPAWTEFTALAHGFDGESDKSGFSLIHARLGTGRTHQIRVHLSAMGLPLVADGLYGGRPALGLTRQALHARRLSLVHPHTGQTMSFQASLAPDLQDAFERLGWDTMAP
jgi:23S rRNA pseudouridine1911/1915/1917 synthase